MSGGEIMAVIGFFLTLIGAASTVWWRIEGKVKVAEDKADAVSSRLSDYRTHVAETYVSKAGLREVKDEIMDAIHGVKSAVDHMGGRIDGIYHTAAPRRTS